MTNQSLAYQNPPWNISLIMLFVLAIGSLIGLMSTGFVQDMIGSSSQIRDFYQSYYIAKWGIELWVLISNKYEYGFEDHLSGSNALIANNLSCGTKCNLDIDIKSRIKPENNKSTSIIDKNYKALTSCTSFTKNQFQLNPWESIIYPLFADQRKLSQEGQNTLQNILVWSPQYDFSLVGSSTQEIWIGIVLGKSNEEIYDQLGIDDKQSLLQTWFIGNDMMSINKLLYKTPSMKNKSLVAPTSIANLYNTNPDITAKKDYFNYLYITNLSPAVFFYCLSIDRSQYGFIGDESIITAISSYNTTQLWLEAIAKKPLLEYIVRPYTE